MSPRLTVNKQCAAADRKPDSQMRLRNTSPSRQQRDAAPRRRVVDRTDPNDCRGSGGPLKHEERLPGQLLLVLRESRRHDLAAARWVARGTCLAGIQPYTASAGDFSFAVPKRAFRPRVPLWTTTSSHGSRSLSGEAGDSRLPGCCRVWGEGAAAQAWPL